jgi:hypothetical protein
MDSIAANILHLSLILQLHILVIKVLLQSILAIAVIQSILGRGELFIDESASLVLVSVDTLALIFW